MRKDSYEELKEKLLKDMFEAHRKAEKAAHEYFKSCEVGMERSRAYAIYDNIRNATRV